MLPTSPITIYKKLLIVPVVILLITLSVALGFFIRDKQKAIPIDQGDEFMETDPGYKKAMESITPNPNEKPIWIPFKNDIYNYSFSYPPNVFLETKDNIVFLDTRIIDIPSGYDSFLTPMQISIVNKTLTDQLLVVKKLFTTESYMETTLAPPLNGKRVEGIWQGYPYDGERFVEVVLDGSKGLIVAGYLPGSFEGRFPQDLFENILATFKIY